jgi:N-acetylmuramic acid 6-phosphate (MurNAc-6-P) etherase
MIDLRATNDKLHDRAIRTLRQLFPELDRAQAAQELERDAGSLRATVIRLEAESTDMDSGH